MKEKADFRGTTQYASPYTHEGRDQCPRDDLYSVIYTFVDFFCGKLPWTDASRQRNKAVVADLKFKYRENSDEFITWMQETISAAVADCSLLLSTTIPTIPLQPYLPTAVSSSDAATKLYSLFPVTVQKNLKQILDYIKVSSNFLLPFVLIPEIPLR